MLRTRQLREQIFFVSLTFLSLVTLFIALFFYGTYLVLLGENLIKGVGLVSAVSLGNILYWTITGLLISAVAAALTWPWALATAVVLELEKGVWPKWAKRFVTWLAKVPLIVYAYVYLQYMAANMLVSFKALWLESFASQNGVTQLLAFASTLFLYPLLIFVPDTQGITMDQFYRSSLNTVINLGEVGLTLAIICLGLIFAMMPRMIFEMQRMLRKSDDLQSLEVVRSMGGTLWESLRVTIIHSMRSRFVYILIRYIRFGFFEGLIVFVLLKYMFINDNLMESFFGSTMSSYGVRQFLAMRWNWSDLMALGGWLLIIHLSILKAES
ncbi:MAG: hypothetical protein MJK18_02650 [Bdellovibrionales bacterium]|nr:hypothetical protein [Bdellovibrionales bacterium]